MKVALFCHSLLSDWNHGNAHFLRGVVLELLHRGHDVRVYEPRDAWSVQNLVDDQGEEALARARSAFPRIAPVRYNQESLDLDRALDGCALVLVHEWNEPSLVKRIGDHRVRRGSYALFFHDTHHRSVTAPDEMARLDLDGYDGVLAFGEAVRERYLSQGWARRVWTWHEAADVRTFAPRARFGHDASSLGRPAPDDLVWVGNWGDEERTRELGEFLLEPVKALDLRASVHGVRYPDHAKRALADAGIAYRGWIANYDVPRVFARHLFTVHVPRRAYVRSLPGVPTIRPFEVMACGVPLVCSPWDDAEGLFTPGRDYLVAANGVHMRGHMRALAGDAAMRSELGARGRATVLERHTCGHRVDQLLDIHACLNPNAAVAE